MVLFMEVEITCTAWSPKKEDDEAVAFVLLVIISTLCDTTLSISVGAVQLILMLVASTTAAVT